MNQYTNNVKENPYSTASALSRMFFWWTNPLIKEAYNGSLKNGIIYDAPNNIKAEKVKTALNRAWNAELETKNSPPKLRRALLKVFGKELIFCIIFHAMQAIVLVLLNAIILGFLIDSFMEPQVSDAWRYGYAGIITVSTGLGVLCLHHELWCGQLQGMQMRVACCSLLYQKILRLPKATMGSVTAAKLLNMISSDVAKLEQASAYIASPFVEPISLVAHVGCLYWMFGLTIVPGFGVLILITFYCIYQGKLSKMLRRKIVPLTDERLKATLGMLSDVRAIKMFTWEASFANVIQERRRRQKKYLRASSLLRTISITNFLISNKLALLPILVTNYFMGNSLSAKMVFVTSTVLASLKTRLTSHMSKTIPNILECLITLKRLEQILTLEEHVISSDEPQKNCKKVNGLLKYPQLGMQLQNMTSSWDKDGKGFELSNINVSFDRCNLLIISGSVGSGKSSMLMAMLREMYIRQGSVESVGTVSYVPQDPWLFPSSIRQNIIFGEPFEEKRYEEVLRLCALQADIERFPEGDLTPVGDKGVSLSGGQKARINLARAMYYDGDIFLMDDPLSALDSRVGHHIFQNCIYGSNENKLRVLVTHHLHYIKPGIPFELITMNEGVVEKHKYFDYDATRKESIHITADEIKKQIKNFTNKMESDEYDNKEDNVTETASSYPESQEETDGNGSNSLKNYIFQLFSGVSLVFFIFLQLVSQVVSSAGDIWLSIWSKGESTLIRLPLRGILNSSTDFTFNSTDMTMDFTNRTFYEMTNTTFNNFNSTQFPSYDIYVFGFHVTSSRDSLLIFVAAFSLTVLFSSMASLMFFMKNVNAAERLHEQMLTKISRAKLTFFDTNPVGRIMNRFSKDMETMDDMLPTSFYESLTRLIGAVGMMVTVIYSSTLSAVAVAPIAIICFIICKVFFRASDDLKRLEPTAISSVFVHLTSTVRGLICVRAYRKGDILTKEFHGHQDAHTSVCFLIASFARWLGLYFEIILTLLAFVVSSIMIYFRNDATADYIGLAITSIFAVSNGIQFGVRQAVDTEIQLSSVDRILEYVNLDSEDGYDSKESDVSEEVRKNWPKAGEIIFRNASLYYEQSNRQVLKSLNFKISSGEKVGIVGRTGAGKSSMTAALFRLARIEGEILIDGVDIKSLPLLFLRKRMSIIPQVSDLHAISSKCFSICGSSAHCEDPVMLIGSIRYNLDPFDEHNDESVWKALDDVNLKTFVLALEGQLNAQVIEGAANFSVGQRQLLCLARAILQNNRIIILDEATANVDRKSDEVVQELVKNVCAHCTILTIAHRLETVMTMDRIMVLDNGEITEFDTPYNLLKNESSMLSKLIARMGETVRKELKSKAFDAQQLKINSE